MNLVLSRHGIWYSRFTYLLPSGKRKEIRKSLRTRCKVTARRKLQVMVQRCDDGKSAVIHSQGAVTALKEAPEGMLLSEAIEKWLSEREVEGLSVNERKRITTYLEYLLEVSGDCRITTFGRRQANEFKDTLLASDRSPTTINNYLKRARMLFNWLSTRIDGLSNPFDGLTVKVVIPPSEQRQAYSPDDLARLDSAVVDLPDYKKWIIQIARYSGMRQGEVCQLYRDNIVQLDSGLWVIDVNARRADQKLKSSNSARLIPIHTKLIDMGLLDFANSRQGGRLFPELSYSEGRGYARYFQKWFGQWRKRQGLPEYHSLRHSVAHTLKGQGVPEQYTAAILGHSSGAISYNRYGKRVDAGILKGVVELIL